jgi:hypothetical protein
MKKIILTFCGLALAAFVIAQQLAVNSKTVNAFAEEFAAFAWNVQSFDFGKIKENVPVSHEFTFNNKGTVPLVISSVQASCGCTVTSFTKEAIQPGGNGFVKATYNASKVGQFTKTISVAANTADGVVQLTIQGEVVEGGRSGL